ncbi:cysteinyl-tRNA synthetase [Ceratobasidium sp. 428]|nr:cysteinyl-tRNA synthetase [Ceratobasidium sp. 428]
MSIPTSRYRIINVRFSHLAYLADGRQDTAITSNHNNGRDSEVWAVARLSNGKYAISNKFERNHAYSSLPTAGQAVTVKSDGTQWDIRETNFKDIYTISPRNAAELYWCLSDDRIGTAITLSQAATSDKVYWKFVEDTGNARSSNPSYNIRLYLMNGVYHAVPCSTRTTVAEVLNSVSVKLNTPANRYGLYLWEGDQERALNDTEEPELIMRNRLEQAGYDETDQSEIIDGEDLRFLLRFVLRSVDPGRPEIDEQEIGSDERVDLTGRGLRREPDIPESRANTITCLNLSKNPLVDLSADFVQRFPRLQDLRLSACGLERIPAGVQSSKTLRFLDLSCNQISGLGATGLEECSKLYKIKLQNNRLTSLPEDFARLPVQHLYISNNKLATVPSALCSMQSLVRLDVSFNSMTSLPLAIGQLTSLERLVAVGNTITQLPEEIAQLKKLKWLDCRHNWIEDFSIAAKIQGLATLRADHNDISVLGSVGDNLVNLDASHNSITKLTLPSSDQPRTRSYALSQLDLSYGALSSLDDAVLGQLVHLTHLRLDHNKLQELPASLKELKELTIFSCANNELTKLPGSIGELQKNLGLQGA